MTGQCAQASNTDVPLESVYPVLLSLLPAAIRSDTILTCPAGADAEELIAFLAKFPDDRKIPAYLAGLARLEWTVASVRQASPPPDRLSQTDVNPTLRLLTLPWKHLAELVAPTGIDRVPEAGEEFVMVWKTPGGDVVVRAATEEDLLAVKMVVEGIDAGDVAREAGIPVGHIDAVIQRAAGRAILISSPSLIQRDPAVFSGFGPQYDEFMTSPSFTLQWHITQACDLHCRHCYDRSNRSPLSRDAALRILGDLRSFCESKHVWAQVSFTGGNPLLYPHFTDVYRAASDFGFEIAILGNPAPREKIEPLIAIRRPVYYQVSLEGLEEQNDLIRGRGHYRRVMEFLPVLRELGIYSMVMLTLTRDNIDQVISLAERLQGLTDLFTFNRLALVGEGARLSLPSQERFSAFLDEYLEARRRLPVLGIKDNLIGIKYHERGMEPFGGCTGYGCGAAFNFFALLPDGEVHACRKFPSLIGNAFQQSLTEIYDSEIARRYRSGSSACRSCAIRPVCGGCIAVTSSCGLDAFSDRDPFCFLKSPISS